jgi:PPOX class probable F420-dependent enzyme
MAEVTDGVRRFLEQGPLGHLVTLNSDGTPHVALIWAGLEGDELVFGSFFDSLKLDYIRRDPRVTISFQANEHEGEGLHPYMVVRGTARISEGGALPVMDRLAEYYIGPGAQFPFRDAGPGYVTRVTIERIYGVGPWRDED